MYARAKLLFLRAVFKASFRKKKGKRKYKDRFLSVRTFLDFVCCCKFKILIQIFQSNAPHVSTVRKISPSSDQERSFRSGKNGGESKDEVNIASAFKLYILNFLLCVSYCVSNCVLFSCSAYILTIYVAMLLIDEFHVHICRIFQFQNFKRTKKRVLEEDEVDGALVR